MKKLYLVIVVFGTVVLMTMAIYYKKYSDFLMQPVFSKATYVTIDKGTNFGEFVGTIEKLNANGDNWQWRLFSKLEKVGTWLTVGEFLIDPQLPPLEMMKKIKANDVISYQFTIVEGINWQELKVKLQEDEVLKHELPNMDDRQLLQRLSSDKLSVEGLFLPETYQFVRDDSDVDVLIRAHKALNQVLQQAWSEKKPNLPLTSPYEMLTLASIVEKETSKASERGIIAGVFVRRLQKNMRLQTDPTVIYGLGQSYDGDIRSRDLKTDTPYNTYTRKGLTPTPIAMASKDAIMACSQPVAGKSLYFVANNQGGHYFSDTYEQHQRAVKAYLKGEKL